MLNWIHWGPFRWSPTAAEEFTLRDHRNKRFVSSKEFSGKPTVVIFYLGAGCLSCTEQIKKFVPKISEFEDAGFQVIAVSSDDDAGLKQSIKNFDGKFPFTIVNDLTWRYSSSIQGIRRLRRTTASRDIYY